MASISASNSDRMPGPRAFATLGLLTLAYAFNFMDRFALVAMVEPVKRDLALSDAQIGLLLGFAFSLVYAALGVPMAALADRWGRVQVISLSLALWSVMTMAASRAIGFGSLAATRVGVGVGEAGGTPPAHSILADTFKGRWTPVGMAIYSTGSGIGLALGLALGGVLANALGWRTALAAIGAPGLILAIVIWLAVPREAPARAITPLISPHDVPGSSGRSLLMLATAMGFAAFGGFAALAWLPPLGLRIHGQGGATALGAALGAGNMLGILGGGLAGIVADRSRRVPLPRLCAIISICTAALLVAACLTEGRQAFVWLSCAMAFSHSLLLAPVMSEAQRQAVPGRRATASAVVLLLINTLGAGGGPWVVGILADALGPAAGLRHALAWAALGYLPAAGLFLSLPRRESQHVA
ncbi:MFS transporter [Sphingomonas pruni]|uniref:MFS transporter n=1 Tax=Sphingomonas pruni TaxID=40683 RepID=UPI000A00B7A9|nr:MFS transporter [Sphingomonas pruni]